MEKVLAGLVIVLLVLALVCLGYGVSIIAGFVAYTKWHIAFSILTGFGCILAACGVCDAMTND